MSLTPRTRAASTSFLILALLAATPTTFAAPDVLIAAGATWKYLDDGSNQGTTWKDVVFDDSTWASGPAQLGYGEGDEATVVSFGGNPSNKHITTYFRHEFNVVNPAAYATMVLKLVRDDGAIVYLNGAEIVRNNLPAGAVAFDTTANGATVEAGEHTFRVNVLDPALLSAGNNVLAVEIHQVSDSSSDISFDVELLASADPIVTRGPYLQLGTPTSVRVRWRTDIASDSRVWYGTSPGSLTMTSDDLVADTEHEVLLSGLTAATRYYYAIGTTTTQLEGDATYTFLTPPTAGSSVPTRVWLVGDSGTANGNARAVRDAYKTFAVDAPDLWLMLGDNAYPNGNDTQYQGAVFDTYPEILRQSVVWPARGNHEVAAATYFSNFTLPAAGEAGGMPSGTEAYYSFDHANIHFICLDSEGSDRSVGGAMYNWLESDLAATTQEWIIAYWHHPPYTKGSHNSDTESKLVDMRTNILPLLEDGGVDLVFNGHSHSYERSFLIDGHYGVSTTFAAEMKIDGGDGRPGGDGAYNKAAGGRQGTVYCVAGSSGKLTSGPLNHPVMFHSVLTLGSVVLDVDGNRLDATFVDSTGAVDDTFTLIQGATQPWDDLGQGLAGTSGEPRLAGYGALIADETVNLILTNALPGGSTNLVIGFTAVNAPFKFGTLVPFPHITAAGLPIDGQGALAVPFPWLSGAPAGFELFYQYWLQDPAGPVGWAASNAVRSTAP